MTSFLDQISFSEMWVRVQAHFFQDVLSWAMAVQIAVIAAAIILAFQAVRGFKVWSTRLQEQPSLPSEMRAELPQLAVFKKVIRSFLISILVWIAYSIAGHFHWPRGGLYTAGIIAIALTLVRLFTESMTNRFWAVSSPASSGCGPRSISSMSSNPG